MKMKSSLIALFVSISFASSCNLNNPNAAKVSKRCVASDAVGGLKEIVFSNAINDFGGNPTILNDWQKTFKATLISPLMQNYNKDIDRVDCVAKFALSIPSAEAVYFDGKTEIRNDLNYFLQPTADASGDIVSTSDASFIIQQLLVAASNKSRNEAIHLRPAPASNKIEPGENDIQDTDLPAISNDAIENIKGFYAALHDGNGELANGFVIPEKRNKGSYNILQMNRFYGELSRPVQLTSIKGQTNNSYLVTFDYAAGTNYCDGKAIVHTKNISGRPMISSIVPISKC